MLAMRRRGFQSYGSIFVSRLLFSPERLVATLRSISASNLSSGMLRIAHIFALNSLQVQTAYSFS